MLEAVLKTVQNVADAINNLAEAIRGSGVPASTAPATETTKKTRGKKENASEAPAPATPPAEPPAASAPSTPPPAPATTPPAPPPPTAPTKTKQDLIALGSKIIQAGKDEATLSEDGVNKKAAAVKEILAKHGSENISGLKPEVYDAVFAAMAEYAKANGVA